ncbi:MAG: ATP-binding protein, partial [Myxococcales bacterium]|nr:ATP-binding protein [Myxococcales bacterium]
MKSDEPTRDLVEQALDNLVKQFANPMDFLRELVQNSIDAGSPRIEVELRFKGGDDGRGVAEIEVRDFGQGMDEDVIDSQLTRLFASAKEGDRTAIGKFGIGFTSVFAIRPDVVRVITGKHGEAWEVLFLEDRSFEKRRHPELAGGTTITIYKRMRAGKVAELARNARKSLVHWCEHAVTPIRFVDTTAGLTEDPDALASDDVFAAFATEEPGEILNQPFVLHDAIVQVEHTQDGVVAVVGWAPQPSWSFFSGGLTLLRSNDPVHLAKFESQLRTLSFKILARNVGHTLTRDNVIQDANWEAAMRVALAGAVKLRVAVLDHMEQLAAAGDAAELATWHARLVPDLGRE